MSECEYKCMSVSVSSLVWRRCWRKGRCEDLPSPTPQPPQKHRNPQTDGPSPTNLTTAPTADLCDFLLDFIVRTDRRGRSVASKYHFYLPVCSCTGENSQ
ncbi:hypothetical protein XELAEV_18041009mg [Xenopus laevis]|uniref:Uncharacterized protein n=1 Tax=Xenopus laevis TaxID=8355 RepID=A0A974C2L8_XENLA|nr:hypothetical protein XELAEV_18041009mg [Xenopus laevis]